jgi:tetratricopeptide (TPR) repeat protein
MFRVVRAMALATAALAAVAGGVAVVEAQQIQAQPARGKPTKGKAAGDDANSAAAPVDAEAVLDKARRALAEGKAEAAFGLADSVVKNAKKDPRNTARALAVRGEAHLRLGRPAEALADLDSALWVKGGLAGADREAATTARAQALQQSGLATNATAPARSGSHQAAGDGQSSGLGGFFSNIFGGGSSKPSSDAEHTSRAPSTTATTVQARPVEPAVSSWEPQRSDEPPRKHPPAAPAKPARATTAVTAPKPPQPAVSGAYRILLAAVRSRPEAEAMAQAVRKDQAAILGTRSFEVIEQVYGNMGRFYRVRIGQFAHPTEAAAVCSALRQKKVDCLVLDP